MNKPDMKKVFQGEIFSIWQWEQELYDGSKQVFEKATRSDTVRTIGVMPDNTIVCVWDEQPDRNRVFGLPGGQVDEGESPEAAAQREFLEETGYETATIAPLFSYKPAGRVDYYVHFFIAKHLTKIHEPQQSAGEKIELQFFTFDEFLALGHNEELRDLQLRIMLLEAQLDPAKKEKLYNALYA
ncbi:MAG: NUDIX hydrolase [Candidatus Andersenbacteria bacterium]|nr:NUDIX hydrolase [Candidatus Andersenbacteria bacterium]